MRSVQAVFISYKIGGVGMQVPETIQIKYTINGVTDWDAYQILIRSL